MAIKISNIDFGYKNTKVLTDLSFTVDNQNIVAILGNSGSGKSTILRLIAGLETPQKGTIEIKNKILFSTTINIPPEKRGVGMVFQDYALFPHLNVEKNIMFGVNRLSKEEKQVRLKEVLKLVDLQGFEKRYPHELSGGQQQRIALARSLAPKPSILLLDEPFSNLDESLKSSLRKDVKHILNKAKITAIFVTHDKHDALSIADKVIILEDGKIKTYGNPHDVLC